MNEDGGLLFSSLALVLICMFTFMDREVYPQEWEYATHICEGANSSVSYLEVAGVYFEVTCKSGVNKTFYPRDVIDFIKKQGS